MVRRQPRSKRKDTLFHSTTLVRSRLGCSKAILRPEFGALNPAVTLVIDVNPAQLSTGRAGNPDLLPQKSDSFDATIEKYWNGGFVAVAGYYRKITNRSEEHTSELQSLMRISYAVFCLKKKNTTNITQTPAHIPNAQQNNNRETTHH